MNPELIEQWFPTEQQRNYISKLTTRRWPGLTRHRAECFVRLWTYLLLKQQEELGALLKQPLMELDIPKGFIPCTHREAAELFYAEKERGSERSAGMMIDRLSELGLIEKNFDGNSVCIQIRYQPKTELSPKEVKLVELVVDAFNPRTDAVPAANLIANNLNGVSSNAPVVPYKINKALRTWAKQYPQGMRVLRRSDNLNPVGFYILYPASTESEANFFIPPNKSLYFGTAEEMDPFTMAIPGESDCSSVFIRAWEIDAHYQNKQNVSLFLEDMQQTLVQMQREFPDLCDMYCIALNPREEALRISLGGQMTVADPKLQIHWVYKAIDQFVSLDIKETLSKLEFTSSSH
ncbi:hypothetical protein [Lyngbya aestuarii]|uniref:hypothetical protein n=1 Tax=Lyngbya aestuarii TaxID=118322 RepID=UPI00403DC236